MKEDLSKIDCIFIDDDELNQMTWSLWAESNSISIRPYLAVEEFLKEENLYPKDTLICLDYNLGKNKKASDYISTITSLGFTKIVLATADESIDLNDVKGVLAIIGKDPNEALKFLTHS